jgi:hypothetical protein
MISVDLSKLLGIDENTDPEEVKKKCYDACCRMNESILRELEEMSKKDIR